MNVLFIAPFPEPTTSQSLASKVFLDELEKHHSVTLVNLSCPGLRPGIHPWSRVEQVLAETIARLMRDRELCFRMSKGARRVASEMLDWNVTIARTLRCCRVT